MKRSTVLYAIGVLAVLVTVGGYLGRGAANVLCGNAITSEQTAPTGPRNAIVSARRCGATAPLETSVSVRAFRPFLPWITADVFRVTGGDPLLPISGGRGKPWIRLTWRGVDTLDVTYDSALAVSLQVPAVNGVTVNFHAVPLPNATRNPPDLTSWVRSLSTALGVTVACVNDRAKPECADTIEARQLRVRAHGVERRRDTLRLPTKHGTDAVVLLDQPSIADFVQYRYLGYVAPAGAYFVNVRFTADDAYLMVLEKDGSIYPIEGVPLLAPGGERFVTTSGQVLSPERPPLIEVWRIHRDSLEREWTIKPNGPAPPFAAGAWAATAARWTNATTLQFETTVADGSGFRLSPGTTVLARRADGRWQLAGAPPSTRP